MGSTEYKKKKGREKREESKEYRVCVQSSRGVGECVQGSIHTAGGQSICSVSRECRCDRAHQRQVETGGDRCSVCGVSGRECVWCVCTVQRQCAVRERVISGYVWYGNKCK
ncbi:hypothetical protein NEIG_02593 [Nematocida sp. ERTm5]|nr:hypothetical protein NEIG_02593 [Nematocida sp. ERTm5]